ncbi:MAG TPA: MarP family serine protease [Acidimicrobiales bacterium]|nr:MarP family serine protease [Acidimicrobiales bacterium]
MNWLDLLIIVLAAMAGAAGYRMGLLARAVSWFGLALGLYVAARLIPHLLDGHEQAPEGRLLLAAASILVIGGLAGQALGMFVGARLRRTLPYGSVHTVDRFGGAFAGMLGVFVALWLLLPAIAEVPDWPARQARTSAIARAIDGLFPTPPDAVDAIRQLVDDNSPQVFSGLKPAPDVPAPPDSVVVAAVVDKHATDAVFRVDAPACGRIQEGSGFAVGPDLVATNAHVVAGSKDVSVHGEHGDDHPVQVVAFDPFRDIAILRVDGMAETPLQLGEPKEGDSGAVYGHPGGGDLRAAPFSVAERVQAEGKDLFGDRRIVRDVLVLSASLRPGDSGAPVVREDGTVIGIAFAVAPDRSSVGYALTSDELQAVMSGALDTPVSTGHCLR